MLDLRRLNLFKELARLHESRQQDDTLYPGCIPQYPRQHPVASEPWRRRIMRPRIIRISVIPSFQDPIGVVVFRSLHSCQDQVLAASFDTRLIGAHRDISYDAHGTR